MPLKTVRVEISGTEEYMKACKEVVADGKRTMGQLLLEGATMTHQFAVQLISQGGRSGKLYKRWKGEKFHQASAPGEPPKSDKGVLLQNLTIEKEGTEGYTVGSRKGAPWGFWLQFGTAKMGARPWLDVAFNKMMSSFMGKYK